MNNLKLALRQLLKNPGFSTIAILTLALGIGANTAIFSVVNGVLLRPLGYKDSDRLVQVFEDNKVLGFTGASVSAPTFVDWRRDNTVFEDLAAFNGSTFNWTGSGVPDRLGGMRATPSLFSLLRVNPQMGRLFTTEEDVPGKNFVVLLSHALWQRRFGGEQTILGKSVTLDGNSYAVIGVLPPDFQFAGPGVDVWIPMAFEDWALENRGGHNYGCLGRLREGVSTAQAQVAMSHLSAQIGAANPVFRDWTPSVVSLQDSVVGSSRRPLLVLLGVVGFVLLIACVNIANLLLARATGRHREFAIRTALGASHGRIAVQLLCESLVLAAGGALLGTLLAVWGVKALAVLGAQGFPRLDEVAIDGRVLGFTLLLALASGVAFGLVPAWVAFRANPGDTLKASGRGSTDGHHRHRLRACLIICEVALSLLLLVGAGLLLRSFARLQGTDPGFDPAHMLTTSLFLPDRRFKGNPRDFERGAFMNRVAERIASVPGVESAAAVMGMPFGVFQVNQGFYPEGRADDKMSAGYTQISPDFFKTMKMSLMRGRLFDSHDTSDKPYVAVVNEAFARTYYPGENPLGKRLTVLDSLRGRPTEIVGVVRDIRSQNLATPPRPEMYFPIAQRCWFEVQLVVRTKANPAAIDTVIRQAVMEVDPEQPIQGLVPMDGLLANSIAQQRLLMLLLASFAGVALALSAIGIYGVMAYVVNQRTQEIGIRMALGARLHDVLLLVFRQGMRWAVIGSAIGLVAAMGLTRLLGSQLFETRPLDPLSLMIGTVLMLGVALLACYLPARRAAKVDPLEALRHE